MQNTVDSYLMGHLSPNSIQIIYNKDKGSTVCKAVSGTDVTLTPIQS